MSYEDRSGNRYDLVLHPSVTEAPGVRAPFASPESFLAGFSPAQRADMLRRLRFRTGSTDHDVCAGVVQAPDIAVAMQLTRLVRTGQLGFVGRGTDPALQLRSGGDTSAVGGDGGGGTSGNGATPTTHAPQDVVCELISIEAMCSHKGRKANKQGLLEVVPGRDDDLIKLVSHIRGGCGQHSRWEIQSPFSAQVVKTGVNASFAARSWGFKLLGIFEVQPKSYYVICTCCSGPTKQLEIRAYPIDEWEIAVKLSFKDPESRWGLDFKVTPWQDTGLTLKSEFLKSIKHRAERVKWALDKVLVPLVGRSGDWEFFTTQLKFSGKWVEYEKDYRCFYQYSASLEFDPLLKGIFTIPFGPTSAIPPWIKKWTTDLIGDLYLYLKFEGEIKLAGKWARNTPDTHEANVEGSGKITLRAGGNLFLMKRGAVNLDVNGSTNITAEAKAPVARRPAVEYDVKWGGLEIELTIEAAWGLVEYKRKWQPIEGFSLLEKMLGHKPEPWYPFGQ